MYHLYSSLTGHLIIMLSSDNEVTCLDTHDPVCQRSGSSCAILQWSFHVAQITEVPPVAFLPNFIVQRKVLRPFRYQTGGTILVSIATR